MNFFFLFFFLFLGNIVFSQEIKVACVGDSVTFGYGLEKPETDSYPKQLQQLLGEKYHVENFGKSGATLLSKGHRPYIQQNEYKKALAFKGDWVIIHLGLNDTDPRNWPNYQDEFIIDYLQLINDFRIANPNCKIWICRMTPISNRHPRFKSGTRDWHEQIQNKINQIAQTQNVNLIDLYEPLYHRVDLFPDGLHPNKAGAGIIAKTVYQALTGDFGGLQMANIFSNKMILQRSSKLPIFGKANADEKIVVSLENQQKTVVTDKKGNWEVTFVMPNPILSTTLKIESNNKKLVFQDVAIGDVWLCSGQSNMAFMVKQTQRAKETLSGTFNPKIRLFNMKPIVETKAVNWSRDNLQKLNNFDYYSPTCWTECNAQTVGDFSAIAYYFAEKVSRETNIPIGLICNAIGGSPTEAWIDRHTMEFNPYLIDFMYFWNENDFIQKWIRERGAQNLKLNENLLQRHPYKPCYLYDCGIKPFIQFDIAGFLWYQGESNAHNFEAHEVLFKELVKSWRNGFGEKPFYFVQLSSMNRPSWPAFRNSQRLLADSIPNVAMVVSSDLGELNDVHPKRKKEIGERLANLALKQYYHKSGFEESPKVAKIQKNGAELIVTFNHAKQLRTSDLKEVRGFEVAGVDGIFYTAKAEIKNNQLFILANQVKDPRTIRYAWKPFTDANLVNEVDSPLSTFKNEI